MNVQKIFFLGLLTIVSLAFIWLVSPFLMPVFWAATLAIVFNPVQRRVAVWLRGRATPAALLMLLLILLTVIVPAMLLISAVANEASALYAQMQDGELDPGGVVARLTARRPAGRHAADGEVGVASGQPAPDPSAPSSNGTLA